MATFLIFVFLVVVIVWLVLNGLNEMKWVQAHSHDEEVAADPGIIPTKADLSNARDKIKEKTQAALQEDGALGKAKQSARNSLKEDGVLGKAKQKAQDSLKEDGVLGKAKQKAQDSMKDDGVLGKAKQKIKDGGYAEKVKEMSKGAGGKLKDASNAARNRVDDMRAKS